MLKDILTQIEDARYRLYAIAPLKDDPLKKEKLLRESRYLDLLILEYYRNIPNPENIEKPNF